MTKLRCRPANQKYFSQLSKNNQQCVNRQQQTHNVIGIEIESEHASLIINC